MTDAEILGHVDHTILRADARWEEVRAVCEEALRYHTASACIPPCYVGRAAGAFPGLNLCTVVGFPLGNVPTAVKVYETRQAIKAGAREIDMVVNIGDAKDWEFEACLREVKAVRAACKGALLKVIVETCLLAEHEKRALCGVCSAAGADFIKTSTGFGSAGAELSDIALFSKHLTNGVKIKAAGGIRTREQMEAFLAAGCERIGTSAASVLFENA